jgi:hypothetical protein
VISLTLDEVDAAVGDAHKRPGRSGVAFRANALIDPAATPTDPGHRFVAEALMRR